MQDEDADKVVDANENNEDAVKDEGDVGDMLDAGDMMDARYKMKILMKK